MDFGFSEEQDLLRGQARDFLDKQSAPSAVRTLMASESGHDPALWSRMADLGWTAIPFPEQHGGLGLGMVDLTVVLEEMGRHVTPSPLLSSVGLAGMTLLQGGSEEQQAGWLPGLCDGSVIGTVAMVEQSGRWDARGVQMPASRKGDSYLLRGEKLYVTDAHLADWMIVAVRTAAEESGDGVTLLLVDTSSPGVSVRPVKSMDQTRRMATVSFDDVEVPADRVVGGEGRGWSVLRRGLDRTLVAISAELCGVAQRAMEMSVEYAKTRQQFGRPIGSYQAVSHKCADMLVQVESAKSLTYYAAWAVDEDVPEAPLAAAMAKAYASDAARSVTANAIQVHGGIGFTWEHDMHLYFKRAKWGETMLGDAVFHRERVAQALEL
ncbi:MAG TPA: acyl-CoA dehydrogenase family protein [Candidatus Dormibacteraeota bacterium]|jgi:alkylation response protein AidB-like acyl-CoA dehydrogenase|nr:acyl-CoA dehydrogenase family protein [Candidatus Dormibacteraeota bacterium]